jgi:hypothetical protein
MNIRQRYLATVLASGVLAGCLVPACLFLAAKPFGASETLAALADRQAKAPETVFLPFDLRYNGAFKLDRVRQMRPDVLCISSSRAGTLAAPMFAPYRFSNMSFTAWTTEQIADMFERATRNSPPRVAIISIDYFLFTEDWERGYSGTRTQIYGHPWNYLKSSIADFVRTYAKRPQVFRDYLKSPTPFIGTQSILGGEGFRSDGSYVYSSGHIADSQLHNLTAAMLVNSMPGAPAMSERQKEPLARMARLAQQRGIKLIGVQLPYIRAGVNYLDHNEAYRHYSGVWREFESEQTRAWLKSLGITFFDLARSTIDDDNQNFVDAYHTSELGSLRVMQQLLTLPEFRAILPDIDPAATARQIEEIERPSQTSTSSSDLSGSGAHEPRRDP